MADTPTSSEQISEVIVILRDHEAVQRRGKRAHAERNDDDESARDSIVFQSRQQRRLRGRQAQRLARDDSQRDDQQKDPMLEREADQGVEHAVIR